MASLNWALLSPERTPITLPAEKFLLSTNSTDLFIHPAKAGQPLHAKSTLGGPNEIKSLGGIVFCSNLRLVYVASEGILGSTIQTLSIPWSALLDSRLVQPFFGSNYFEALILPATDGNLNTPHNLRISFNEGGAFPFNEMVIEMKARSADSSQRAAAVESLPVYSPPPPTSPLLDHSLPSDEDLGVAAEARRLETLENDNTNSALPPPTHDQSTSTTTRSNNSTGADQPPAYI